MRQIWFSTYQLKFCHSQAKYRSGIILKVTDGRHEFGYADVSPWPELGDPNLTSLLSWKPSAHPLLKSAIENAISFLNERSSIDKWLQIRPHFQSNNALIIDLAKFEQIKTYWSQGFRIFKIKIGRDIKDEVSFLSHASLLFPEARFRLDANLLLTEFSWSQFWNQLSNHTQSQIDYIEDPFPFDINAWKKWNQIVPLALDFALDLDDQQVIEAATEKAFQIYVMKPSRQTREWVLSRLPTQIKISVTSQLGHLVDSLWSGWVLHSLRSVNSERIIPVGGTLNHLVVYENDPGEYHDIQSLNDLDRLLDKRKWELYASS